MVTLIYIIIGIIAIYSYQIEKYVFAMTCFMALFTNLFMFLPTESEGIRSTDVVLVCSLVIIILNKQRVFYKPNDLFCKYTTWILIYSFFQLIYTIVNGAENLSYALKVLRIPILICFVFVVRSIPFDSLKKFFRVAFIMTVVDGVFYYLEFVGLDMLPDVNPLNYVLADGSTSSCIIPIFSNIFLFCCVSGKFHIKYH